ncbi:MAG TPA: heparan-alpha-glucosaminide N-acetyltransferase domain-containing protein [Anaeromyxobacteraceae bacterium]|nr:heparan-alpha-glucosaminide N-acetyltransferase domain-containing protein [Anaeromyxobacteraceae bacterium]
MPRPRRGWLDLQRGLAVVFMVEVHALDAWLAPGARAGVAHDVLLMVGGFAAPSFLFMAGLSQALGEASLRRRSVPALARLATHLRRAGWLLAVAYGFRIAEWLLGGQWRAPGGWSDVLRVDVLNVIALGLALAAPLALVPRRSAVAVAAAAAAAIALATPPIADWAHEPSRVLDYLWATWPRGHFSLFNWAAFLLAGSAAGALLAERDGPALLLAIGAALLAAGWAADRLPPFYARQDFWRASPSWLAMRLGGVCILAGALQLLPARGAAALPALTTLGRHSLLGYVASVELTYGALAAPLRRALSLPAVLAGVVVLLAVTWTLARAAEAWPTWQAAKACAQPRAKASGAHHAS